MENTLIFTSEKEVRFGKLLKFIIPTYLTSLFNTVYTIIDGIFVSAYVGTDALASINIVYPIVNVLTGIALVFATGGSAVAALHIGGNRKAEADSSFSVSTVAAILLGCLISLLVLANLSAILSLLGATCVTIAGCITYARWWLLAAPVVIGKELFTYFIRVDGAPTYSFLTALSGGILNIILDYVLVGRMHMGIYGAALATILGLVLSFTMGIYYFICKHKYLSFTLRNLSLHEAIHCMINGASEFVDQLAIAITTIVFNRTALSFAGEDGDAHRFFIAAPIIIYALTYFLAPAGVSCFTDKSSPVFSLAVSGMRIYGLGFLFSGINIYAAVRMMAYGKGYFSGLITFLRSFALLLLFLAVLPRIFGLAGVWLAVPVAEALTLLVSVWFLRPIQPQKGTVVP